MLAVIDVLSARIKALREEDAERGDISITTVIIWVAVIAAAVGIAGAIIAVVAKYQSKLNSQGPK
ncbi:hypothetical protein F7Q99_30835 [Streptomyces kaniharaensis]|uniref:Uncharacterized protein n=2 Tax=Streptomyces kaniharaensis TaxID=212423 RepID=A0A6N7L3P6_9ACTN|nr:hypothetical protein [Streptomyces kaniharaensis]